MLNSTDQWSEATPFSLPRIDHLGLVVRDVAPVVSAMRAEGFQVSDPVELEGPDGPLGQVSAHCLFASSYLEISAPIAGSGNHLEPLLTHSPGWHLLVFGSEDCAADRRMLEENGVRCGTVQHAARMVELPDGAMRARFRWFAISQLVGGMLVAMVEHQDADVVFDPRLADHPNGVTDIESVLFGSGAANLGDLCVLGNRAGPKGLASRQPGQILGLRLAGPAEIELSSSGQINRFMQSCSNGLEK